MIGVILRTLFLCGVLALLSLGALKYFLHKNTSSCAMTFMYESPQFIPIPVFAEHRQRYPNYNLYLYGEGAYAEWLRKGNIQGIPVLFLPGSSGSYKQVRSLASVSLTKAQMNKSPFHFNYFTVDFNEEISAMYGGCLFQETEYAAIAVKTILSLYDDQEVKPSSVILVGHSMGGLVAKAILRLPKFDTSLVSVIFTQATPHLNPVFEVDFDMIDFYHKVNAFWAKNRNGSLKHINLVSLGGGENDLMVRSDLVHLPQESELDVVVLSTSVPGVWTSTDHLSVVWCNQLVVSTVRAMFKLIDKRKNQILVNPKVRAKFLKNFFLLGHVRAEKLSLPQSWGSPADEDLWTVVGPRKRRYSGSSRASALVVPVERGKGLAIYSKGMDLEPYVFGCRLEPGVNASESMFCKSTGPVTCNSPFHYLPAENGVMKLFHCQAYCCSKETHFIVKLPANQTDVEVVAEAYEPSQRKWKVSLADLQILYDNVTIDIPKGSLFATIEFPQLLDSWQAYRAVIVASGSKCSGTSQFVVPWSREETYKVIKPGETVHSIRLFSSDAKIMRRANDTFPELRLYFYSECTVKVTLQFSLLDMLEQITRFDVFHMPGLLAASLLLIFSKQLSSLATKGVCKSFWRHFSLGAMANDVVFAHLLASVVRFSFEFLPPEMRDILPGPSLDLPASLRGVLSVATHLLLYCSSAGIVLLVYGLIFMGMVPPAKVLASLLDRFGLFITSGRSFAMPFLVLKGVVCLLLAYFGYWTCGAVVLFPLLALFALELFRCHLAMFRSGNQSKRQEYTSQCRLSISVYLLWGMILQLNAPTLVFWIQNLRESGFKSIEKLDPDPSFISALFLLLAMWGSLKVDDLHRKKELFRWLSYVQRFFAYLLLVFGLEHFYLVTWILTLNVLIVSTWIPLLSQWWLPRWRPPLRSSSKKLTSPPRPPFRPPPKAAGAYVGTAKRAPGNSGGTTSLQAKPTRPRRTE